MADLEMFRGNTRVFTLTARRDGAAVDLTGGTVRFTLRVSAADADTLLLTKTVGAGVTLTDPTNGVMDVSIASSDTKNLYAPQALIYDVELIESGGDVSTVDQGVLLLKKTIVPV